MLNNIEPLRRGDDNNLFKFLPKNWQYSSILLPQLYKLTKMRGLNLGELMENGLTFYDENGNAIIDRNFRLKENLSEPWQDYWQRRPSEDKPMYKDTIREVELKYPGLFQRMYVTEAEENEALREIEGEKREKQATTAEPTRLNEEETKFYLAA
jgi:hypothetical protein